MKETTAGSRSKPERTSSRSRQTSPSKRTNATSTRRRLNKYDYDVDYSAALLDPPANNLEIMAAAVQPPKDVEIKEHYLQVRAREKASEKETTEKTEYHQQHLSPKNTLESARQHTAHTQTFTTKGASVDNDYTTKTKDDSRHPSPTRERTPSRHSSSKASRKSSDKTKAAAAALASVSQSNTFHTLQSLRTDDSGDAPRQSYSFEEHIKQSEATGSRRTAASSKHPAPNLKVSTERLEVLVMQLRETEDEKEAATIVLEFALRIQSHELVVLGADLSIINAMKRFSNSHKIQTRGCKALAEMASKGLSNIEGIIDKGGCDIILIAMEKHRAEEDLQKEACRAIECISRDNKQGRQAFGDNAKNAITCILHSMKDHPHAAKLHRMACRSLASIASGSPECSQNIVTRGGLDWVRRTLKNHDDNTDVIEVAFEILINVASAVNDTSLAEEIAMTISMDRVLAMMTLYRKSQTIQSQGMALLCILCKSSHRNRAKIATLYGLEVIVKSLENCVINKDVLRHGTSLIQHLCQSEGNAVAAGLMSEGGMELLLNIVRRHGSDAVICQQIYLILAKMARPFSDTIRKEGGIDLILSGMRRHEASINVQEAACLALWKLSAKTENANAISGQGGVSLINAALARFPADENISEVACEALASLSHDKQMLLAQQTLKARAANKKPEQSWGMCGAVSCF